MTPVQTLFVLFLAPLLLALVGVVGFKVRFTILPQFFSVVLGLGAIFSFYLLSQNAPLSGTVPFFKIDSVFQASFFADEFSLKMCTLVYFIACLVAIFSVEYMREDPHIAKYYTFLSLFVFSMLGLLLVDNLWVLYIFWELVGFCSYLLIGFWHSKPAASQAAQKAFIINRVGDLCLLLGIFYFVALNGSASFLEIGNQLKTNSFWPGLLLFLGCMAKSAQFPFHAWLPTAMEGPTPVSALIHAATMVAAGVYLAIRIFPLFAEVHLVLISVVGAFTMLMAGVKAFLQTDIKKVLAYSTVSQLGLMFVALGQGFPELTATYLLVHAFFKAGMFFGAGSIIHGLHHANPEADPQNMYFMGGILKKMPLTSIGFCVCAASMLGVPFTSGFVAKELLISQVFEHNKGTLFGVLLIIGSIMSAAYMFRLVYLVFIKPSKSTERVHENSFWITLPIALLALFSTQFSTLLLNAPAVHWGGLALLLLALLGLSGLLVFRFKDTLRFKEYTSPVDWLYVQKIGPLSLKIAAGTKVFDENVWDGLPKLISYLIQKISAFIAWFDTTITDGIVKGIASAARFTGNIFRKLQTGQMQWYLSAGLLLLLLLFYII
jgi:NADH-quinone oxidoreductase subunit L